MRAYQQWCQAWAAECLRVLKPGGHLLAFGGTRTWHRLACAIEDAGFEIRDTIAWMYGSGFPKSRDVSKDIDRAAGAEREVVGRREVAVDQWTAEGRAAYARGESASVVDITAPATPEATQWQGWGTAMKPAHEPIVVARKPLTSSVAGNVLQWGTGGLNVDACRIETDGVVQASASGGQPFGPGAYELGEGRRVSEAAGRWPANVVLTHGDCPPDGACVQGCPVGVLDQQSGDRPPSARTAKREYTARDGIPGHLRGVDMPEGHQLGYADAGSVSRFFPVFRYAAKADSSERPRVRRPDGTWASHPTVKPLELMRWLVRLVTPPGGTILDPFAGSGATVEACLLEGFRCVAVEQMPVKPGDDDYIAMIVQRINRRMDPVAYIRGQRDDDDEPDLFSVL